MKLKRIFKTILIITASLVLLLFVLKYLWVDTASIPQDTDYFADIREIRKLAAATSSELPLKINSLKVGEGQFPAWLVIAGGAGKKSYTFHFRTFQVIYPKASIVIDPVHGPKAHKEFDFATEYSAENFEFVQQALLRADEIICTHEHWDHVGGIAHSPHFDKIRDKSILTQEQINSAIIQEANFPAGSLETLEALKYENYHTLAPGMVLIKAPGHTPGSQMIFVRLKNGQEYLFLGDIVWTMDNINQLTGHSRLVSWLGEENRKQQFAQIRWLYNLQQHEKVVLISAHDSEQHKQYISQGLFSEGLE